jgi:hypothetical protein
MAVAPIQMLTTLLVSAGELGVASRFVEWLPAPIDVDYQCASRLMVREGRIDDAVHLIEADLRDAVLSKRDLSALKLATLLVESGERARDAEVAVDLARLDALLAKEAEALYAFTDPFPWYRVMMPSLRARLLARSPDTLERAIELQRASFERANTDHPHIAPSRGCLLADHLVRAGRHTEALPVCDEAEALARARLRPRDLAETLAVRLRALVALDALVAERRRVLDAMEAALDETGAPRPRAEVWLALARELPAGATLPDPLRLADDARALFEAMPMPLPEGESALVAGDVLAARGAVDEALARYRIARRRHTRYGIKLFLPRIAAALTSLEAPAS